MLRGDRARCLQTVWVPGDGSRGVVGQVQEEADIPHGAVLLEVRLEEPGCLHVHLDTQQGWLELGVVSAA